MSAIAADEGSAPMGTQAVGYHHHQTQTGYHPYGDDPTAYQQQSYEASGAGPLTMYWMMATVMLAYGLLFALMCTSCFMPPRMYGFARMRDVEAATQPKLPVQMPLQGPVAELDKEWRNAFIAKVYAILSIQLAATVSICFGMMQFGGYQLAMWSYTDGYWTRTVSMLGSFGIIIALMCYKNRHPLNLILLGSFTVCMSYVIGLMCTAYAAAGLGVLVVEAFAITSVLFVGLTVFTMYSKIDFSFLGLMLPALLLILIVWGLFAMVFFESFVFRQVYAALGCVIFVLYILFDTHQIITYLAYDDYVLGAVNLYLDFINLFIFVLQCLMGSRSE
jgi:FtsH-binding integral membrane protein